MVFTRSLTVSTRRAALTTLTLHVRYTHTQARAEKALVARVNAALRTRLPSAEGPEQEAEPLDDVGYVVP